VLPLLRTSYGRDVRCDGDNSGRTLIGRRLRLRTQPSHFLLRPHTFGIPRWRPQCCDASYVRVIQEFLRGLSLRLRLSFNSLQPRRGPRQPERRTFSIPTPLKTCRACMLPIFWRKLVPGKRQKSGILLVRCLARRAPCRCDCSRVRRSVVNFG
jgi:hypothetical protein